MTFPRVQFNQFEGIFTLQEKETWPTLSFSAPKMSKAERISTLAGQRDVTTTEHPNQAFWGLHASFKAEVASKGRSLAGQLILEMF